MNESLDTINEELMKIKEKVPNKEQFYIYFKTAPEKVYKFLFYSKFCSFRRGFYPTNTRIIHEIKLSKEQLKFIEFIKSPNVFMTNNDWSILFNEYKNDKNSIIIFDPPYLKTDKRNYDNITFNVYDYISQN